MAISTGAAILGSAIIGGAAASSAGSKQAAAIEQGSELQAQYGEKALDLQADMAEQQRADLAPWRDVGQAALQDIAAGVESGAFDPGKFEPSAFNAPEFQAPAYEPPPEFTGAIDLARDPGYQFRLEQGIEARDKSAAARGRLLSGAQQKAIEEYAQGVASQEYQNVYARESDIYSKQRQAALDKYQIGYGEAVDQYAREYGAESDKYLREASEYASEADRRLQSYNILAGLSSTGQSAATRQAGASSQLASSSANILSAMGQARGGALADAGTARAGAYGGTAQSINQAAQNWLTYKALQPAAAPTMNYGP